MAVRTCQYATSFHECPFIYARLYSDFGTPRAVSHVWPMSLVETGSALKQLFINVQDELFLGGVYVKGTPGDGKQFITHT